MRKKIFQSFSIVFLITVFATLLTISAFAKTEAITVSPAKKARKYTVTVKPGDKLKITIPKVKSRKAKYKSNKKKLAVVNKKGIVTFKKNGTAKITVSYKKKKAVITAHISNAKPVPNGLSLNKNKITIKITDINDDGIVKGVLKATINPWNRNRYADVFSTNDVIAKASLWMDENYPRRVLFTSSATVDVPIAVSCVGTTTFIFTMDDGQKVKCKVNIIL